MIYIKMDFKNKKLYKIKQKLLIYGSKYAIIYIKKPC